MLMPGTGWAKGVKEQMEEEIVNSPLPDGGMQTDSGLLFFIPAHFWKIRKTSIIASSSTKKWQTLSLFVLIILSLALKRPALADCSGLFSVAILVLALAAAATKAKGERRSRPSKQRASLRPLWTIGECARAPSKAEAEGFDFDNCLPGITTMQANQNKALHLLMLTLISRRFLLPIITQIQWNSSKVVVRSLPWLMLTLSCRQYRHYKNSEVQVNQLVILICSFILG